MGQPQAQLSGWDDPFPDEFPAWKHSLYLPEYYVILDWGREGNWKDPKKKVQGEDTSHRKVPTFVYEKSDEDQLIILCMAAKEWGVDKKHFG